MKRFEPVCFINILSKSSTEFAVIATAEFDADDFYKNHKSAKKYNGSNQGFHESTWDDQSTTAVLKVNREKFFIRYQVLLYFWKSKIPSEHCPWWKCCSNINNGRKELRPLRQWGIACFDLGAVNYLPAEGERKPTRHRRQ